MPSEICSDCKTRHVPSITCIQSLVTGTRALLLRIGNLGKCHTCGADIVWVRHSTGKSAPYDMTGVTHFSTCPDAELHRRREDAAKYPD